jgi:hypothetical protein
MFPAVTLALTMGACEPGRQRWERWAQRSR